MRSATPTLLIIGTGSLARSACASLAVVGDAPVSVVLVGRSAGSLAEVEYITGARAALTGRPLRIRTVRDDLASQESLIELLAAVRPTGVLLCASTQSPWEADQQPSAWTDLLGHGGFGLTLPFQATLAASVGRAVAAGSPSTWFINACYPDAVNPLLYALGVPVLTGVGNVGIVAASLRAALRCGPTEQLRVLAHHAHLHTPIEPAGEARAWRGADAVPNVGGLLAAQRAEHRASLNLVTGHSIAVLLLDLLAGATVQTSLPGPLGLPGGYPVRVGPEGVRLDLPAGLSEPEAVAFNERAAFAEGVVVRPDHVEFTGRVREWLDLEQPALAEGFAPAEFGTAAQRLGALRERLRGRPVRPGIERPAPPGIEQPAPPGIRQPAPPGIRQPAPPGIKQSAPPGIRQPTGHPASEVPT